MAELEKNESWGVWAPQQGPNNIKVQVFFGKRHWEKHLCRHDKNDYYFWKSNISVINLIVDSRNMIKFSKNMRL